MGAAQQDRNLVAGTAASSEAQGTLATPTSPTAQASGKHVGARPLPGLRPEEAQ